MSDALTKWKELPLHSKLKYSAEIIAVIGGLILLGLNAYQLKLLQESNAINRDIFNSTFPLDIETEIIGHQDKDPIIIKLRIKNVAKERINLETGIPRLVSRSSHKVESGIGTIETAFFNQNGPVDNQGIVSGTILNPLKSCVLEIKAKNEVDKKDSAFIYKPQDESFIILPLDLRMLERTSYRTILISLSRNEDNVLSVSSKELRISDEKMLLGIIRLKKAEKSLPEW